MLKKIRALFYRRKIEDALHILSGKPEFQCDNCRNCFEYEHSDENKNFKQCMANLLTEELARSYHKHFKCAFFREKIEWPRF